MMIAKIANLWQVASGRLRSFLLGLFMVVVAAIVFLSCVPTKRAFVVAAETYRVEATPQVGGSMRWNLKSAIICTPLANDLQSAAASDESGCSPNHYEIRKPVNLSFEWPAGRHFILRKAPGGGPIAIEWEEELELPEETLPPKSLIAMRDADWRKAGALLFSGQVAIGVVPPVTGYMISGHYEVREELFLRSSPVVVAEGDLMPGDRAEIVGAERPNKPAFVQAFVSANPDPGREGFQVIIYSPAGQDFLRLDRMRANPALIGSNWYDKALKDPWLLALAAIMTFISLTSELWIKVFKELWPRRNVP
jgi:hypothetical protein